MVLHYEEFGRLSHGHAGGITSVSFSPGGNYLASAGLDGRICVWDVSAARLLYSFEGDNSVLSLAWIPPAEDVILCGFQNGNMAILKIVPSRLIVRGFSAHAYPVECLAVRSSDNQLASGAHRELLIWQWDDDEEKFSLVHEIGQAPRQSRNGAEEVIVTSIQWTSSPQHSALMLVTYMYHGLVLFNASDWSRVRTIPLHGQIASASLSDDGTRLVISNVSRGFDVYSMQTGAPLCTIEHDNPDLRPLPVCFIHGGLAIVGGSVTGELTVWDVMDTERGSPLLNTPENDDPQPHVLDALRIPRCAKVLAISAYYNEPSDEFLIAAGVMNETSQSIAILFKAVEHGSNTTNASLASGASHQSSQPWYHSMSFTVLLVLLGAMTLPRVYQGVIESMEAL